MCPLAFNGRKVECRCCRFQAVRQGDDMPAYFIAEIEIEKPELYAQYVERAAPIV
jgi:hypothetical protein